MMQILKNKEASLFLLVRLVASPQARLFLIMLFFTLSAYIGYKNVYVSLTSEIELPSALRGHNARIDANMLDVVINTTLDQQERTAHNFDLYRGLFSNTAGQ